MKSGGEEKDYQRGRAGLRKARLKRRVRWGLIIALGLGEGFLLAHLGLYYQKNFLRKGEGSPLSGWREEDSHPVYQKMKEFYTRSRKEAQSYQGGMYSSPRGERVLVPGPYGWSGCNLQSLKEPFQKARTRLPSEIADKLGEEGWDSWFWPNMGVRYLILKKPVKLPKGKLLDTGVGYYLYELENALPPFYFQDRWVVGNEDRQLTALLDYDLRDVGYCPKGVWTEMPAFEKLSDVQPLSEEEWIEHFVALQENNKIIIADFSDPDRLVLEADVSQPCLLVMTDFWQEDWRGIVIGPGTNKGEISRLNYLQRGVWCRPGRYRIILERLPPHLRRELVLTAGGLAGLIVLALLIGVSPRPNRRSAFKFRYIREETLPSRTLKLW